MLDAPLDGPALVRGEHVLDEGLREGLVAADPAFVLRRCRQRTLVADAHILRHTDADEAIESSGIACIQRIDVKSLIAPR